MESDQIADEISADHEKKGEILTGRTLMKSGTCSQHLSSRLKLMKIPPNIESELLHEAFEAPNGQMSHQISPSTRPKIDRKSVV
jgi:hypothetical protein